MADYTLDLGDVLVRIVTGTFIKGSTAPKITDGTTTVTGVISDDLLTITFAGFGTLTASHATESVVTFTADAAAPAGTYAFIGSTGQASGGNLKPYNVTIVNAAAMTNAMIVIEM